MIINHPLLGPRDAAEFVYLGDESLIERQIPMHPMQQTGFMNTGICAIIPQANTKSCGIMNKATGLGLS